MHFFGRIFPSLFDYSRENSFANRLRRGRAEVFRTFLRAIESRVSSFPVKILDVGGTYQYWRTIGFLDPAKYHVTLLNIEPEVLPPYARGFASLAGNAQRLPYTDQHFDVVFSNSVIEHMGSRIGQQRMAEEVRRVGKSYFIQTPSKWFPLEPHSGIPFFQFFPRHLRALLIYLFNINYFPKQPTYRGCLKTSDSTIMLSKQGLRALFPEARIYKERLWWITKSYSAVH